MSKRDLSKYLSSLSKKELEKQVEELYDRLTEVRQFYNFVFNPKEEKMVEEAKFKISKEYFPQGTRKPKRRRSVAQKHIKNFIKLGVDSSLIADVMLYNIEVAQAACGERPITQDAFYKSMLKSFQETIKYLNEKSLRPKFKERIVKIVSNAINQNWINKFGFDDAIN
jgi:Family of unknown function (DUF6155)